MSQTMLLTKRLTTFLSQNTTSQLPTLLLISPTGKLLASSSPLPASRLRTQATLACSLWNLYQPLQANPEALTNSHASDTLHTRNSYEGKGIPTISTEGAREDQSCITIQLSDGVMVIRSLKCQLLFIAIGAPPSTTFPSSPTLHTQAQHLSSSSLGSQPGSPLPHYTEGHESLVVGGYGERESRRETSTSVLSFQGSAAPSEVGSLASASRGEYANIMAVKRQADEVGKWLEKSLEGFALSSAEVR